MRPIRYTHSKVRWHTSSSTLNQDLQSLSPDYPSKKAKTRIRVLLGYANNFASISLTSLLSNAIQENMITVTYQVSIGLINNH